MNAWRDYKKRHPVRAFLWDAFCIGLVIGLLVGFFGGPFIYSWWDCGQVCSASGDENFYRLSQGCYCLDSEGKPYNPKDTR